ncbi:MAG: hypothetical protein GTO45_16490 [Candidatus Aminicenantes bacterium]|nr:hypothetical protein [Candidatus Aminicenantes bacterium]NIM78300.1 hypothetical protein [Candidatus Aminicenantes bacterium]NIN19726.1 hypothetical protein [Candidatus Aminicenantes bacterium]NIN43608.1 hypothetical protein [Candidatus Aminicenantes bacterium]NIN86353.1 hypothetical protein [Candidatus Aminicenantes bacterium]
MKRGCKNGMFNVKDLVYFTVIVDEKPYTVKYKILEKIECIEGFGYVIDVVQEQDDPEVLELVRQRKIGTNFRICGDSLFKTREGAVKKAREYFQKIIDQLS